MDSRVLPAAEKCASATQDIERGTVRQEGSTEHEGCEGMICDRCARKIQRHSAGQLCCTRSVSPVSKSKRTERDKEEKETLKRDRTIQEGALGVSCRSSSEKSRSRQADGGRSLSRST
jgi:hypothetical protein